ncbi:hypothetical protein [Spirochaeta africana]|uniref:Cell surface protein SprA n=1 Tax=Spirochaeta africana (strain ATCC 700263 / DSM 8902 / Z-7692) TaxID=889378 RepID=H9UJ25_SPIAZ|nr:hypothetical protein [Spirochaeta africana]AFG37518.1 hypothetical protein Spiaf_1455 [Spirochaeta africana DSM 8902]
MTLLTRGTRRCCALTLCALALAGAGIAPARGSEVNWSRLLVPGILVPEDEEALFTYDVDDAEVSLLMSGTWRASSGFGLGFRRQPAELGDRTLFGTRLPGFSPSPLENQVQTITSVWIENRYFLSTELHGNAEARSFLIGYRGTKDEVLQSAVLGYGPFTFPGYPGLTADPGTDSTAGLMLHFLTPDWENHTRLTVHSGGWDQRYFASSGEIQPDTITLRRTREPREFVLPDAGAPLEDLRVWVQDPNGSLTAVSVGSSESEIPVRRAREGQDYRLSLDQQVLQVFNEGAVLLYYRAASNGNVYEIGDSALGSAAVYDFTAPGWPQRGPQQQPDSADFGWDSEDWEAYLERHGLQPRQFRYSVRDGGTMIAENALLLHLPGRYSPFGRYNRFPSQADLPETGYLNAVLSPGDTPTALRVAADNGSLALSWSGVSPREPGWRYPLYWFPDVLHGGPSGIYPEVTILPEPTGERESAPIKLPVDLLPGSLQVFRNGRITSAYRYDAASSTLELYPALLPDEVLLVRFYRAGDEGSPLLQFRSGLRGQTGNRTNWSVTQQGYWGFSDEQDRQTQPRTARTHAELNYRDQRHAWHSSLQLSLGSISPGQDARLIAWDGMRSVNFPPQGVRMAAPPGDVAASLDQPDGFAATLLRHSTRGELRYRITPLLRGDYLEYPSLALSGVTIDPGYRSTDGDLAGPYLARPVIGGSTESDPWAVIEYALGDGADWVGAQLLRHSMQDIAEADLLELSVVHRLEDPEVTHSPRVLLQFGRPAEDLDNDGTLDSGSNGIPFSTADGRVLLGSRHAALAGLASGSPTVSEDWGRSGSLDPGMPPSQWVPELSFDITDQLATTAEGDSAATVQLDFSQLSSAARRQLQQATGVRVLVVRDSDSTMDPEAGILALGNWRSRRLPIGDLSTGLSTETTGNRLIVRYDPAGYDPGDADTAPPYYLSGPITASRDQLGREAVFTLHGDSAQTVSGRIQLYSPDGSSSTSSFVLLPNETRRVRVPIQLRSGAPQSYRIELTPDDPEQGFVVGIEEPSLEGSRTEAEAGISASYRYAAPGQHLAGPLHSPQLELAARARASGSPGEDSALLTGEMESGAGIAVGPFRIAGSAAATYNHQGAPELRLIEAAHSLAAPLANPENDLVIPRMGAAATRSPSSTGVLADEPGLHFLDSYRMAGTDGDSRRRRLHLWARQDLRDLPLRITTGGEAAITPDRLRQSWILFSGLGRSDRPLLGLEVHWQQHSGYQGSNDAYQQYPGQALQDYQLLMHPAPDVHERILRQQLQSSIPLQQNGQLAGSLQLGSRSYGSPELPGTATERQADAVIETRIASPEYGPLDLQLSYELQRGFDVKRPAGDTAFPDGWQGVAGETAQAFSLLSPYRQLIWQVPGLDMSPGLSLQLDENDNAVEVRYQHAIGVNRSPAASRLDLWLPQALELKLERRLQESPTVSRDRRIIELNSRYRATNMFGRTGAAPYFSWYDIDDYIGTFRTRLELPQQLLLIQPRLYSRFVRSERIELNLEQRWETRLLLEQRQHDWRSDSSARLRFWQEITTTWSLLPEGQLQQGPDLTVRLDNSGDQSLAAVFLGYHVSVQRDSNLSIGADLQLGSQRRRIDSIEEAFWDTGITASLYAEISW